MPGTRDGVHAVGLALACFRYEAACLERSATVRWVREAGGWSMRAIASYSGLSPSTIGRLVKGPGTLTVDDVRVLRARWGVDQDPASSAAADHIVARLIADELLSAGGVRASVPGHFLGSGVLTTGS
ncbi:helix-turn-helix transcriptional regulator [Streptomyces sp. NEAU-S7GS2]|uniref:helix-turn-helix domain-containing protein n=1 Tax=Streptomyces sp. NEAU-S7GS2 TaxID=2202000 RepID=UPI000D6ED418|nr:helix-turn-helix transcriptional regulator [Streptomyces sp. NEAU-S7GS2]AWN24787.1 hypothetical protein DKG71_00080 [Streptomyces sp. NEAU-S7GS2]